MVQELVDDTIRAFVAVELPESVQAGIADIEGQLKQHDETNIVRWVDPDLTHITLHFLGNVETLQLPHLKEALDTAVASLTPFSTETGLLGAFPNVFRPSVLWLGVDDEAGNFQDVKNAVSDRVEAFGDAKDRHEFIAHITIGRVDRRASGREKKALGQLIGPTEIPTGLPFDVKGVTLFRSQLTPDGPIYTRLSHHPFGSTPA